MERNELEAILARHARWLAYGEGSLANLREANLRGADLRGGRGVLA